MTEKSLNDLIDKFDAGSLSELTLEQKDFKLTLKKESTILPVQTLQMQPVSSAAAPVMVQHPAAPAAPVTPAAPAETQAPAQDAPGETVDAPIVGTFYRSPSPDSPAFAEPGTTLKAGDTICIIEAMKLMNKMETEYDLEILEILVQNGDMVECGTPLFRVKRL